jgi:hypothetical protein
MISTDETVMDSARGRRRDGVSGRMTRYFCGCTVQSKLWPLHWCDVKREALKERKCAYSKCSAVFTPARPGQVYHGKTCAKKARPSSARAPGKDRKLRLTRGLTVEEIHAMEIKPLTDRAEKVQREASAYAPIMGEALVLVTLELMRRECAP